MAVPRDSAPQSTTTGWSLERRLPLLILALLACVIGAFSVAAYREVRGAAVSRATDRLERFARELSANSVRSSQARLATLRTLAQERAVVDAVLPPDRRSNPTGDRGATVPVGFDRADAPDARGVAALLTAVESPGDSTFMAWELWGLDGTRRWRSADLGQPRDSVALAAVRATVTAASDSVRRSSLYAVGSQMHLWSVAPVRAGGRTVGVLAERRRLANSAQSEQAIRRLTGEDVRVLVNDRDVGSWASLRGQPMPAPFVEAVGEDSAALVTGVDGAPLYVVQGRVRGTPWRIVLVQSQASVLARPRQTLRRLLGVGALLLVLGTVGAWLLGRHVAGPLRRVTDAASALAAGDYGQRVTVTGGMEVASLASTFNTMAERLGDAHAALAERNAALQRANDAKGQFLAMMSHELRTPLNAIGGYTELLELGLRGSVTAAQVEDLGRIRRNKDHLLSVISDILTFSRTEAGALPMTLTPIGVDAVFHEAVEVLGPEFQAKGVQLLVEPTPADAVVLGDPDRLQQVVLNLLSNALKFTEPSGRVVLRSSVDADHVRVEVRDTGIGIAPERLADIFEPFVQVDGALTRRVGGTGLGLAIARRLMTAMDGELTVESTPGAGSRFTATFPRRADAGLSVAGIGSGSGTAAILAD